jgi:hypothetical protein
VVGEPGQPVLEGKASTTTINAATRSFALPRPIPRRPKVKPQEEYHIYNHNHNIIGVEAQLGTKPKSRRSSQ